MVLRAFGGTRLALGTMERPIRAWGFDYACISRDVAWDDNSPSANQVGIYFLLQGRLHRDDAVSRLLFTLIAIFILFPWLALNSKCPSCRCLPLLFFVFWSCSSQHCSMSIMLVEGRDYSDAHLVKSRQFVSASLNGYRPVTIRLERTTIPCAHHLTFDALM